MKHKSHLSPDVRRSLPCCLIAARDYDNTHFLFLSEEFKIEAGLSYFWKDVLSPQGRGNSVAHGGFNLLFLTRDWAEAWWFY